MKPERNYNIITKHLTDILERWLDSETREMSVCDGPYWARCWQRHIILYAVNIECDLCCVGLATALEIAALGDKEPELGTSYHSLPQTPNRPKQRGHPHGNTLRTWLPQGQTVRQGSGHAVRLLHHMQYPIHTKDMEWSASPSPPPPPPPPSTIYQCTKFQTLHVRLWMTGQC